MGNKSGNSKPNHQLSVQAENMLADYEFLAITRYNDKTQKPYFMGQELENVSVDTFLLEGDKDPLFPFQKSVTNAQKYLKELKEVKIFEQVGHGIEVYPPALSYIGKTIKAVQNL